MNQFLPSICSIFGINCEASHLTQYRWTSPKVWNSLSFAFFFFNLLLEWLVLLSQNCVQKTEIEWLQFKYCYFLISLHLSWYSQTFLLTESTSYIFDNASRKISGLYFIFRCFFQKFIDDLAQRQNYRDGVHSGDLPPTRPWGIHVALLCSDLIMIFLSGNSYFAASGWGAVGSNKICGFSAKRGRHPCLSWHHRWCVYSRIVSFLFLTDTLLQGTGEQSMSQFDSILKAIKVWNYL